MIFGLFLISVLIMSGCAQQPQPLTDSNLQIVSLSWNERVIQSDICDRCKNNINDCEPLNAGILETNLDYSESITCSFKVDGIEIGQGYQISQGKTENNVKMNVKQGHSFTVCCKNICKSASVPALC